jgi:uncharacterized protein
MDLAAFSWVISLLAALYAVTLFVLVAFQRVFIFLPTNFMPPPQEAKEQERLRFTLTTADGETLDAVWRESSAQNSIPLLYLHGTAANLPLRAWRIKTLSELGFSVLAIDWRSYGRSSGRASEEGLRLDAEAALRWLRAHADLERIVILGESLGTNLAVEMAATHAVGALVLESPFYSLLDLLSRRLPMMPIGFFLRDRFRSDLRIEAIKSPLLVQHGRRDFTVPFRHGERLFALAPEPKRFIAYARGGHNDLAEKHGSYRDLRAFIDAHLTAGAPAH